MQEPEIDVKSERSPVRLILVDGVLTNGVPFAILMIFGGFFIEWLFGDATSFFNYLSTTRTWIHFVFYLLFFGLFMGVNHWLKQRGSKVDRYKVT